MCLIFRYNHIANYNTPRQAISIYPGGISREGFWHPIVECRVSPEAVTHTEL